MDGGRFLVLVQGACSQGRKMSLSNHWVLAKRRKKNKWLRICRRCYRDYRSRFVDSMTGKLEWNCVPQGNARLCEICNYPLAPRARTAKVEVLSGDHVNTWAWGGKYILASRRKRR